MTNTDTSLDAPHTTTFNLGALLAQMREKRPLIHQITNMVVMNDTANITLALGALPVMAHAPQEVEEMARLAGALVLNIGTLQPDQIEAMLVAGKEANARGVPIVLDPVGAGATTLRTQSALRLLRELKIAVLRGNAAEIGALVGIAGETRGVESMGVAASLTETARTAAREFGCVAAISGKQDVIDDGQRTALVDNGDPLLPMITGSGCMATTLIGCYLAVSPSDPWLAAVAGLVTMGLAGEIAGRRAAGPGTFRAHLLDAVASLTPETLDAGQKVSLA